MHSIEAEGAIKYGCDKASLAEIRKFGFFSSIFFIRSMAVLKNS